MKYLRIFVCRFDGIVMDTMCFAVLGAALGWAYRWPMLFLVVSILALAIGVEGALNDRPPAFVITKAALMHIIVQGSYFASALTLDYVSSRFATRRT